MGGCEKFQIYGILQLLKMYFQVKILTLDIFTHMLPPPSPLPAITLAVSGDHDLEY